MLIAMTTTLELGTTFSGVVAENRPTDALDATLDGLPGLTPVTPFRYLGHVHVHVHVHADSGGWPPAYPASIFSGSVVVDPAVATRCGRRIGHRVAERKLGRQATRNQRDL